MKELSLHILDLAENAVAAGACHVLISLETNGPEGLLRLSVEDDGAGMDPETLRRALEPGFTTRETGRGGNGLPLLHDAVQSAGGGISLWSAAGGGTEVRIWYPSAHVNALPIGDIAETMAVLLTTHPDVDVVYRHRDGSRILLYSTAQARQLAARDARPGFAAWNWTRAVFAEGPV